LGMAIVLIGVAGYNFLLMRKAQAQEFSG